MKTNNMSTNGKLLGLFFLSGIAALIYQVCWQRLLFSWFGVDIESITIIVSLFMFGLGLGALVGGWLADHYANKQLLIFCLIEIGIGLIGASSPFTITAAGQYFQGASHTALFLLGFALLVPPTMLMGASLPVLVAFVNRTLKSIGLSIGSLYFANTLGAAAGSIGAAFILFVNFTLNESIFVAASVNITVAIFAYIVARTSR